MKSISVIVFLAITTVLVLTLSISDVSYAQQLDNENNNNDNINPNRPISLGNNQEISSLTGIPTNTLEKMKLKFDSDFYDTTIQMIHAKSQGNLPSFLAEHIISESSDALDEVTLDEQDRYPVIVIVNKPVDVDEVDSDFNPLVLQNKEELATILENNHDATNIYIGEKLSFVAADIPITEIPKLSKYDNIVDRLRNY